MKRKILLKNKHQAGFGWLEILTLIPIIIMVGMIAYPMYQQALDKKNMAEAETVLNTLEEHLQTYFVENGKYISLDPNPATVPGMDFIGRAAPFTENTNWAIVGYPVDVGTNVFFSYQTFAGQTSPDSPTAVTEGLLHSPTDNMNLERKNLGFSFSRLDPPSSGILDHMGLSAHAATMHGSGNYCENFGVSTPVDFGVQKGIAGYNWVVLTAVANFRRGNTCSLVAKTMHNIKGESISSGLIYINYGQ